MEGQLILELVQDMFPQFWSMRQSLSILDGRQNDADQKDEQVQLRVESEINW